MVITFTQYYQINKLSAKQNVLSEEIIGIALKRIALRNGLEKVVTFPQSKEVLIFFLSDKCPFCQMSIANISKIIDSLKSKVDIIVIYKERNNHLKSELSNSYPNHIYNIDWSLNKNIERIKPSIVPTIIAVDSTGHVLLRTSGIVDNHKMNIVFRLFRS